MNKYIVLLIIPFLLFHVGCEKDQDNEQENNTPIPVSQYPESILGHWKYDQTERTQTYKYIDPVYGTEIMDTIIETVNIFPIPLDSVYLIQYHDTYKYDGTIDQDDFIFDPEDLNNPIDYMEYSFSYTINENIIWHDVYPGNPISYEIIQLTETSLHTRKISDYTLVEGDTTYLVNTTDDTYMSRVNELPPPSTDRSKFEIDKL